jgi:protein-S-isoprenylcysteine O-methyltransferase Ste14
MSGLPPAKLIDLPPVWLALFVVLARIQATRLPLWPVEHPLFDLAGGLLVGGGVLLMLVAVVQMQQNRTTIVPHLEASVLVTNGVFARSRNPIYLGDAMVLAGLILFWGNWVALVLVPLFMAVIADRFIRPEEARLAARFGPAWTEWSGRVRRWL